MEFWAQPYIHTIFYGYAKMEAHSLLHLKLGLHYRSNITVILLGFFFKGKKISET